MPLPTKKTERETDYLKKTYLIYGEPKIGKTTIISQFGDDKNKTIVFPTEPGHKFQEIYKYTVLDRDGKETDPYCWIHFQQFCKDILTQEHEFKMIVIDIADHLFKWCSEYVCTMHKVTHESDLAYGKGYALVAHEFQKPIQMLAQKGYGVAFVSHAGITEKQIGPRKVTYTDSTLNKTAKKIIHTLCDYIFYFHANDEGKRLIRTKSTENYNAGDRSGKLPELLEMDPGVLIRELSK